MEKSEGILRKIRALMAKTIDAGCTEEEAKAAAEAVDRLMRDYDIAVDDLTVRTTRCDTRKVNSGAKSHPARFAVGDIADFTDTKSYVTKTKEGHEVFSFFGLEPDLDIAEYLYWLFKRSIDREVGMLGVMDPLWGDKTPEQDREARKSFGIGMASRLGQRLREMKASRDMHTQQETGRSLIVVKGAVVTEEWAKLNLKISKARGRTQIKDGAAYDRGRKAGDTVAINKGVGAAKQTHLR